MGFHGSPSFIAGGRDLFRCKVSGDQLVPAVHHV